MESDICNCDVDVKLSTDTFPSHVKTESQIEGMVVKSETCETAADAVNAYIKQETFVDESFNIKQEIKTEEISSDNEISQDFTNSFDIKQETYQTLDDNIHLLEEDDGCKTKNLLNMSSGSSNNEYQDHEKVDASSGITQQQTTYKRPEEMCGISSLCGNEMQGNFVMYHSQ